MPKFRDTILLAQASRLINTDEFVLLYDGNKPKNPDLPYTNYGNWSFRQPSVRKRVGSIRKRPIVVLQTSYITLKAQG